MSTTALLVVSGSRRLRQRSTVRLGSSQSDGEGLKIWCLQASSTKLCWLVSSHCRRTPPHTRRKCSPCGQQPPSRPCSWEERDTCPSNSFCSAADKTAIFLCWNVLIQRYRFFFLELLCFWRITESRDAGARGWSLCFLVMLCSCSQSKCQPFKMVNLWGRR